MPDILIAPKRGTAENPQIFFTGSVQTSASIRMEVLPEGQVAFLGKSGSLFSITDSMQGSLMAVSDISGLPILEVFSDDRVVMGKFNSNTLVVTGSRVGIGTSSPSTKLAVVGGISLSDNNNIVWGTSGGDQSSGTNTPVITAAASLGFYFTPNGSTSGVRARLTNYGTLLVGDTVEINSSWYNNGIGIFGKNGTDKMVVGYLGSSTSGALIGAHNSALNAWAVTNINGSQIILRSDESERMRIINNGNVGIATSSPGYKLHVAGDIYANGGWFRVSGGNGIYWETHGGGWYMNEGTYIRSYNNKVVMGYNTGGSSGTATAFWATSGNTSNYFGNNQLVLSFGQDTTYAHAIKSRHNAGAAAGNAIDFYTWKQGTDTSATIGTQHVMSLNGGSVGIGTTSPSAKFEVSDGSSYFRIAGNSAGDFQAPALAPHIATGDFTIYAGVIGSGTARVTVKNGGNVGIGTTTPTAKLEVAGDVMADNVLNPFLLMGA